MDIISKRDLKSLGRLIDYMDEYEYKDYLYNLCYYNIKLFSKLFLLEWRKRNGYVIPFEKYHSDIWETIDSKGDVVVIVPRRHGKTTAIKIYLLHALLYKKYKSIIYVSSPGLGEEIIGDIRRELETNNDIINFFGNLVPTESLETKDRKLKKWRQRELELLNGCRIETTSKGGSIRGKSNDLCVIDDPQENKDVESKRITSKFNYWALSSLYNTMMDTGRMVVVGTIIGNLCFVKYLRDEKQWNTIEYKAIENGKPLWSAMWSLKSLEKRKEKIGSAIFNQEFMNIPISKESTIIKDEWIKYYPQDRVRKIQDEEGFENIIMAVDPAIGEKEKNDFTGICIVGKYNDMKYVLHSEQVKLAPEHLKKHIRAIYERFYPGQILVESVQFQEMLRRDLALDHLPVIGVKPTKDKYTRLLEVSGEIEFGRVLFRTGNKDDELIYQITNYPDVEHDDIMDALTYCLLQYEIEDEMNDSDYLVG